MAEKMTIAEYTKHLKSGDKSRVRGTIPTTVDGIRFHSKKEAKRYGELIQLEKAGHISDLQRQVKYPLTGRHGPIKTPTGRQMHYVADFQYIDHKLGGIRVVEDAKGYQTEISRIKLAIMSAQGQEVTLS